MNFAVGIACQAPCLYKETWPGLLDEVGIFNRPINQSEILSIMAGNWDNSLPSADMPYPNGFGPQTPASARSLVGLWRFEDMMNLGKDSSRFDNTLSNVNGVTSSNIDGNLAAEMHGSQYLGFNGFPPGIPIGNSSFSVCSWFFPRRNSRNPTMGLIFWGTIASYQMTSIKLYSSTSGQKGVRADMFNDDLVVWSVRNLYENWHHICYTYDDSIGVRFMYLDGEIATWNILVNPLNVSPTPDSFGVGRGPNQNWDGFLDDVAVFDAPLNRAQINAVKKGDFSQFLFEDS